MHDTNCTVQVILYYKNVFICVLQIFWKYDESLGPCVDLIFVILWVLNIARCGLSIRGSLVHCAVYFVHDESVRAETKTK